MRYFLVNTVNKIPNLSWEPLTEENGWKRAIVYSGDTEIEQFGPLPTTAMVLHVMRKNDYEPLADDMPAGWSQKLQSNLTTKEVTKLFELKGSAVTAACKNGSLTASTGMDGKYYIDEKDAAVWFLSRNSRKKVTKNKRTGRECLLCGSKMVKDGVGNAPLICPKCGYPRRVAHRPTA